MGKDNKFEGFTLRNTATLSLNGRNEEVQQNHLNFTGYLRAYCYERGRRVDVSRFFDRECVVYTTLERGSFYPVITYEGRSLVFTLDSRNLYIKGFTGPNGNYQLSLDEQEENYMLQESLEILDFNANYHALNPGRDVGNTLLGLHPLRKAFDCLWAHKGGKPHPMFRQSVAMISVYICEAARFQPVFDCANTSLVDENISRLNKISQLSECVTSWKFLSREIMTYINYLMAGQTPPQFNNRGIMRYSTIEDLFSEVRILFRDANPKIPSLNGDQCPFQREDPPIYPVFASPVDPGLGDPKIDVSFTKPGVQSLHSHNSLSGRKRQHQYQKSGKRKKPTLELEETIQGARRRFYMGGGVGGSVANVPPFFIEPWSPKLIVSEEQRKPSSSSDGTIASPKSAKTPIASVKTSPFSSGQKRNLSYSSPICMNGAKACEFRSAMGAVDMSRDMTISRSQNLKMSQRQIPSLFVPRIGAPSSLNSDNGSLFHSLNSWTQKLKISQEQFIPFPCKPKVSDGPFCMTMPHACGEKMGMGVLQPWKMDWLDTGRFIRSNKCNVLKWYNDNRHGTASSGHAKMAATPKSFLQNIKPRCSWLFCRVARLLH